MGCVNSKGMSNILTSIPPIVKKNIDGSNTIRRKSNEKETEEKETNENFKDSKGSPIIENNLKNA